MKSFKEYLTEGLYIDDDNILQFLPSEQNKGIKTSFGKNMKLSPYIKKLTGTESNVYSLYVSSTVDSTQILKALKMLDVSNENVQKFLNRSSIYAVKVLRSINPDIIITPQSSSLLLTEFVKMISEKTHYDVYYNCYRKTTNLTNVETKTDHPKLTPEIAEKLKIILDKSIASGEFKIHSVPPMWRSFLKNLYEINDTKLFNKLIGKSVVIIDDIITSGFTVNQIIDDLIINGVSSTNVLTIFKSAH